jgi:AcrR family transcriptional regulator
MELLDLQQRLLAQPDDPRSRVIQAAAELFTTHGYAGTSTDAIARAAGLKPAALYRLFESKEDILYVFLERNYEVFLEAMEEALGDETDPVTCLVRLAWTHTWVQLSVANIGEAQVRWVFSLNQLLESLSEERARRLRKLGRTHLDNCRRIIEAGIRDGRFQVPDASTAALAITTMCEYTPMWFRPNHILTAEEVADRNAFYALRIVAPGLDDLAGLVARATERPPIQDIPAQHTNRGDAAILTGGDDVHQGT